MASKSAIIRLVSKVNSTNDVYAGGGSDSALVPGMVGAELELDSATAALLSDTTIATLRRGRYRYVQAGTSSSTNGGVRGQLAFHDTSAHFATDTVATDNADATGDGKCAGVFLNTVSKSQYGFIQVSGDADVLLKNGAADVTNGNIVVVGTGTVKADAIADATSWGTGAKVKAVIGVLLGTGTDNAISKVLLKGLYVSVVD